MTIVCRLGGAPPDGSALLISGRRCRLQRLADDAHRSICSDDGCCGRQSSRRFTHALHIESPVRRLRRPSIGAAAVGD